MVGDEVQRRIGEDQPGRLARPPRGDVVLDECRFGNPRAGHVEHLSERSIPTTLASGKRAVSSSVLSPGPQHRSKAPGGLKSRICAIRSRAARVRSRSNLR